METAAYITGSAVIARQIVEQLKNWSFTSRFFTNGLVTLVASSIVNFVLAFAWATADGAPMSIVTVRALGQVALAALYHDWKEATRIY